ncbi:MAG: thioredoxin domain-containing protein [Planctomycetota bacterium]
MHQPLPTAAEIAKLPPDGGAEFNRLIFEKSPYLLQHARNPVDWYPWGPEAFAKAKKENKPIFLSIGYSTCHWCHVMERESFENKEIAKVLNADYVAIKVDREERPDLDDIYMKATQLMTQRGGWPNSVWLTPDGSPWFAGTYFPPEDRYGRPGFKSVLLKLAEVWKTRRDQVDQQAVALQAEMKKLGAGVDLQPQGDLSRDVVTAALAALPRSYDTEHAGFGGAPKFPPHGALALMLHEMARGSHPDLLHITEKTLQAMALGGIHDHIGGGFHRYSTDAEWFLPHFEKMLYDNAQLAASYSRAYALTQNPADAATARDICDWVLRDMTDPAGGFYSALDADSDGEEGKFYLWTPAEVDQALGETDGALFCRVYNITIDGNYHEEASGAGTGASIAHLTEPLAALARAEKIPLESFLSHLAELRAKLRAVRDRRIHPHLDDKVLTSWNGLMIGALAQAGSTLAEPRYTAAARKAADFELAQMWKDGQLLRAWRAGSGHLDGYLEDYAFLADGLLDLSHALAAADPAAADRYRTAARAIAAAMVKHFYDPDHGGFFFTADDGEKLLMREKDGFDEAIPSGNGKAVQVLLRLAALPDTSPAAAAADRAMAKQTLGNFLGLMQNMPRGTESLLLAAAMYFDTGAGTQGADDASAGGAAPAPAAADAPDATAASGQVSLRAYSSASQAAPGDTIKIAVKIDVGQGFHIYDHKPQDEPVTPTDVQPAETIEVPPPAGSPPHTKQAQVHVQQPVTVTATSYPDAQTENLGGDKVNVYAGTVTVIVTCKVKPDFKPGKTSVVLEVIAQPCSDRVCLEPVNLTLTLPLEVVAETPKNVAPRHAAEFKP